MPFSCGQANFFLLSPSPDAFLSLAFAGAPDSLGNAVLACRIQCLSSPVPLLAPFENRPRV